ncbi:MAG: TolC family outer membrane protein [Alphaproteobacteria bacterium]|nr:TolC family outer membrane protein [Alphaproteobacteria bacterium]
MKKTLLSWVVCATLLISVAVARADTLEQAMVKAYRANPGLEAQRAQFRADCEQIDQAEGGWQPRINGITSVGKLYTYTPNNAFLPPTGAHTSRAVGVEIVQPIFRGFRTENGIDAAEKKVLGSQAKLQAAEQQLLFNVGKTYLNLLRDRAVVDLYRHNEVELTARAAEARKRFAVGDATRTDVLQAEARLQGVKTSLTEAQGRMENDGAAYLRYVGDPPADLQEPKMHFDLPQSAEDAIDDAVKHNPAVVAAAYGEDAALADVDVSEGALLPEIDVVGSASRAWAQSDFIPGMQDTTAVMLRMTIPLYNAGVEYSQTRAAEQTATAKHMELADMRLAARQATVEAWDSLQTAKAAELSSQAQVDTDARALDGVKKEASVGTRTVLDILNAEQELLAAKVNLVQARYDGALASLQIEAAIGRLTADGLHLPVDLQGDSN